MEQNEKILRDYSDVEKGAYISAIASIATADRSASAEEMEFLEALAESAEVSQEQKLKIQHAATEQTGEELKRSLDLLKGSELRFSLLTDLVAFAESDQHYTAEERTNIEKIAQYLNISQEQFSTINQFVQKTSNSNLNPEQVQHQNFLGSLGMENQFKSSGLNMGSLSKGLLGMAGPLIFSRLLGRRSGGSTGGGIGGMLGGMLGGGGGLGNSGGLGGMLGGGSGSARGGGLGSVIGMLNGGRGIGSTGGLFGKLLKGGF